VAVLERVLAMVRTWSWIDLNDRQRQYMLAIFECDHAIRYHDCEQDAEVGPINITGWLDLVVSTTDTLLGKELSGRNLLNTGVGSVLKGLETRGLIQRKHRFLNGVKGPSVILVKLTPAGRQFARHLAHPII
jgi:DNA-binding MarR family transcriptional regulator